ncbi:hypothetical protein EN837_16290 [bacterium M00.F.Ca.ET.194.01.1.1]|nr:hypothetical protein EN837_16290 [bacterium M00.F.Ca.ET.194.01.1.1]TGS54303.1 hypothetical protein EN822_16285 [bacterium M00.F.Ca.ET.179.01.1.1]TGV47119.1 hypothetical protein EN811_16290 [bacterium M00.F.Ca.ET.168.01.1.1]
MNDANTRNYTIEQIQEVYALGLVQAAELFERFAGDRAAIDKMMKRCPHREDKEQRYVPTLIGAAKICVSDLDPGRRRPNIFQAS